MNRSLEYLHPISFGIGVLGVLVVLFGVVRGLLSFLRAECSEALGRNPAEDRHKLRRLLG